MSFYLTQCQDLKQHLKLSSMQLLLLYFYKLCHALLFFPQFHDSFSSQERVIENLREQKEREDRARLEELEQTQKENQELKNKLSALQPPNASQNQAANPGVTQNQRPHREVGTWVCLAELMLCWWQKKSIFSEHPKQNTNHSRGSTRCIKAVCLVCVLMARIFNCAPNHNRNEQAATAPSSEWPNAQRGSVHIVKIIIMSSFLTDLELPNESFQPCKSLWLVLLYGGIKGIHLNSHPGCNVVLRACVYAPVTMIARAYLPARCHSFVSSYLADGLLSFCPAR